MWQWDKKSLRETILFHAPSISQVISQTGRMWKQPWIISVAGCKTLLELALDEAAARDEEMDKDHSRLERYRKEEVQLGLGRVARILKEGSWKQKYRMGCIVVDTSRSVVPGSSDKPDYVLRSSETSWSLVATVMELKYLLAELYTECLGETTSRLSAIQRDQPRRKHAYGVLLCSIEIQVQDLFMDGMGGRYSFTQRYPWSFDPSSFGLRLLVGMLVADGRTLGFMPPPHLQGRICLSNTAYLDDLKIVAVKGDLQHGSPSIRGCLVYKATLVEGGSSVVAAVKTGLNMDSELRVLSLLTKKKVAGVLPVLHSGRLENGDQYVVSRYCKQITLDMPAEALLELGRGVAATLQRLSLEGVVHCDVSIGNIVYESDGEGGIYPYLIDFGSAIIKGMPGKSTGCTLIFAAVQRLLGGEACLSSDLESLFYVLVYVAVEGKAKCFSSIDAVHRKTSCFFLDELVVERCKVAGLVPAVRKLRDLFWKGEYKRDVMWDASSLSNAWNNWMPPRWIFAL